MLVEGLRLRPEQPDKRNEGQDRACEKSKNVLLMHGLPEKIRRRMGREFT